MVLKLKEDKRGFFFIMLVITILSLFLVSYTIYSIAKNRESISDRIQTMNDFVFLVEDDLPRQLYVSGFRIIFLFEKRMTKEGYYINDLTDTFREAFFNGTIYGNASAEEQQLMTGVKFSDIQDFLNKTGNKINVNVNLNSPQIYLVQEDPWRIKVTLTADLLIRDRGNLALWNRTTITSTYIPVEEFEDPIYIVETGGIVPNKIKKTIYTGFVEGTDVTNLTLHLQNSYYINSTLAPSFLNRLEGKIFPSPFGIESLVYLPNLTAQGIPVESDKSCVDYIYFLDNHPQLYTVQNMPPWFRLDNESGRHFGYQVEGLVTPA